jgi:hypothetical protein
MCGSISASKECNDASSLAAVSSCFANTRKFTTLTPSQSADSRASENDATIKIVEQVSPAEKCSLQPVQLASPAFIPDFLKFAPIEAGRNKNAGHRYCTVETINGRRTQLKPTNIMNSFFNSFSGIEPDLKRALRNTILSVAEAALLASCASAPAVVHDTVGPAVAGVLEEPNGSLQVYSATAWTALNDDGPPQLIHTDYQIQSANGALIREVTNPDEEPARVRLPRGKYNVVAQSDTAGAVEVPVAIEAGKTTVLHLEREKDWNAPAGMRTADLVRLPNGQPIGFRAQERRVSSLRAIAQPKRDSSVAVTSN